MSENIKTIRIIPSKSFAHRAYICDFLAGGEGRGVICGLDSDDISATRSCIEGLRGGAGLIDVCESGSTLRFVIPLAGVLGRPVTIKTHGRLSERPMGPFEDELIRHGMVIKHNSPAQTGSSRPDDPDAHENIGIIEVSGQLSPGVFRLPGSISSQFITGLLLSLPYLEGNSEIQLTSPLQSSAYVEITLDVLKEYRISIEQEDDRYIIKGGQKYYRSKPYTVEGDWSQAAFWLAAGAIGKAPVRVEGLNPASVQGDRKIVDVLKNFGAEIKCIGDFAEAYPSALHGVTVDVSEIPDLAPAIACAGAAASGETRLVNAGRLRLKESDRIKSIVECLTDVGVRAEEGESEIIIHGCGENLPAGGTAQTAGDHRIVMMAAVLSLITSGKVTIKGSGAVSKSYPTFFRELNRTGLMSNCII